VILTADPDTIARRVAGRGAHNRYQGGPAPAAAEIVHYSEAAAHLEHVGTPVLRIDTTYTPPDRVAVRITAAIPNLRRPAPPKPIQAAPRSAHRHPRTPPAST